MIETMWNNGAPVYQIVEALPYKKGIAITLINELRINGTLKPRDFVYRKYPKKCQKTLDIIDALKKGDKIQSEIAKIFGVSRQYVSLLKKGMENEQIHDKRTQIRVRLSDGNASRFGEQG